MAETMLYVNEHLHDQLYDGPVDGQWIRSFSPGEYLTFTLADGESAARGSVEAGPFLKAQARRRARKRSIAKRGR